MSLHQFRLHMFFARLILTQSFCCQQFHSPTHVFPFLVRLLLFPWHFSNFLNNFSTLSNLICPTFPLFKQHFLPAFHHSAVRQKCASKCNYKTVSITVSFFLLALLGIHHMFLVYLASHKAPQYITCNISIHICKLFHLQLLSGFATLKSTPVIKHWCFRRFSSPYDEFHLAFYPHTPLISFYFPACLFLNFSNSASSVPLINTLFTFLTDH